MERDVEYEQETANAEVEKTIEVTGWTDRNGVYHPPHKRKAPVRVKKEKYADIIRAQRAEIAGYKASIEHLQREIMGDKTKIRELQRSVEAAQGQAVPVDAKRGRGRPKNVEYLDAAAHKIEVDRLNGVIHEQQAILNDARQESEGLKRDLEASRSLVRTQMDTEDMLRAEIKGRDYALNALQKTIVLVAGFRQEK